MSPTTEGEECLVFEGGFPPKGRAHYVQILHLAVIADQL